MQPESNYPLIDHFTLVFSAYEDRLLLTTERGDFGTATLLLTRRMVVITIKQLLAKLPDLSGLQQTPHAYWQEVLQMAHQKAVAGKAEQNKPEQSAGSESGVQSGGEAGDKKQQTVAADLYLATELTAELRDGQLLFAFKGLPVPDAMRTSCKHEPVVAFTLKSEQVHQFIELLIAKSTQAQWHLPVDLPWLEPLDPTVSAKTTSH